MAYEIIAQNNTTTTLSDGVNVIRVPARVTLATSTSYTITKVNNNTATLEDENGNIFKDIPCVAVLYGGGSGSALPDQTGQSGKFLTTDGTDASWVDVDALPDQTGQSGKFLTTDGTDASWSDKPLVNNSTRTNALAVGNNTAAGTHTTSIGQYSSNGLATYGVAVGYNASVSGTGSVAIGSNAHASGSNSIQISSDGDSQIYNNDANTFKVANDNGNFEIMSADGTIPAARHASLPATDGTYVLKLVVASGVPTLSWVAE